MTYATLAVNEKSKPLLLLVDDEIINLRILRHILSKNYELIVATNGIDALRLASQKRQPDIILLDIVMPKLDGFEVCKQLKEKKITRDIPVIFLTVQDELLDESKGFDLGAVDYIHKPFRPLVDIKRIAVHLRLSQSNKASLTLSDNPIDIDNVDIMDKLMDIYQMSNAEASLTNKLVNGISLDEIAETTGLKITTLRGYLKVVFQKTFTNKQHELVSVILKKIIFSH